MKITKRLIAGCVVALTLATTSVTAFAAAAYSTPAEAVAGITGKTVDEVVEQRQNGTTYGAIAKEAGKLEEFQQAMQDIYKDTLAERVADGALTQAQADEIITAKAERQATCDGTGSGNGGLGFGGGRGMGAGRGAGRGMQNGSCIYQ